MANANPHQARTAKKRKAIQKAGSAGDLRDLVWHAITTASDFINDPANDVATRLKAVHAVVQAAASYTKLVEVVEFETRLQALEDARIDDMAAGV